MGVEELERAQHSPALNPVARRWQNLSCRQAAWTGVSTFSNLGVQEFPQIPLQRTSLTPHMPLLRCLEPAGWKGAEVWGSKLGTPPSHLVPAPRGGVYSSWPLSLPPYPNPTSALNSVHSPRPALGPNLTFSPLAQPTAVPNPLTITIIIASSMGSSLAAISCSRPPILSSLVSPKSSSSGGSRPGSQEGVRELGTGPLVHRLVRRLEGRAEQAEAPSGPAQDTRAHILCHPVLAGGCLLFEWPIC